MKGQFILTVNAGSSSLKFALFKSGKEPARVLAGRFERIGLKRGRLIVLDPQTGKRTEAPFDAASHTDCVGRLVETLKSTTRVENLAAVGHRIVHGGPRYTKPQKVDPALIEELRRLRSFDPDHLPAELALVKYFGESYRQVPQIACFDTAFHSDMPRVAHLLPIPRRYEAMGIRRYGFHGLSYAYLMEQLSQTAGASRARGRIILAHLGNGASMAAVYKGKSVDTTMAFTPAAGLVMSTRSGDLDPGLPAYFARTEGMTASQFNDMVNTRSGLLGISETSPDVRDLLGRERKDRRAAEAIGVFCYQAGKTIGALAAALGGLDVLVFSGGIGENSAPIRSRICRRLKFLGIELDPRLNRRNAPVISQTSAGVEVRVIRTDEELQMAKIISGMILSPKR